MQVTLASEVTRKAGYLSAAVGEEQVLLDMEHSVYIGLNAIGSDIWQRIEHPVRVATLCEALHADYDADVSAIEADVVSFLERLLEQGLIEMRAHTPV